MGFSLRTAFAVAFASSVLLAAPSIAGAQQLASAGGDDVPSFSGSDVAAAAPVASQAKVALRPFAPPADIVVTASAAGASSASSVSALPSNMWANLVPFAPKVAGAFAASYTQRAAGVVINSPFGYRTDPINGSSRLHAGVDLKATYGQTVGASQAGTVVWASPRGGYGNLVVVDHGAGVMTRYGHLSGIDVAVGQQVAQGQAIGRAGSTGRSTGVHLHYEVRVFGAPVNPTSSIKLDDAAAYAKAYATKLQIAMPSFPGLNVAGDRKQAKVATTASAEHHDLFADEDSLVQE